MKGVLQNLFASYLNSRFGTAMKRDPCKYSTKKEKKKKTKSCRKWDSKMTDNVDHDKIYY